MRVINVLNKKDNKNNNNKKMYKIIFGHSGIDPRMFFDFNVLAKTRRNHIILR